MMKTTWYWSAEAIQAIASGHARKDQRLKLQAVQKLETCVTCRERARLAKHLLAAVRQDVESGRQDSQQKPPDRLTD